MPSRSYRNLRGSRPRSMDLKTQKAGFVASCGSDLQASFEEYINGGPSVVRMKSGVEEYEFDFVKMLQTNIRTNT